MSSEPILPPYTIATTRQGNYCSKCKQLTSLSFDCDNCLNDSMLYSLLKPHEQQESFNVYKLILHARSLHFYNSSKEYDNALIALIAYTTSLSFERVKELVLNARNHLFPITSRRRTSMQTKIAVVVRDGSELKYFTAQEGLSLDPTEAMLFTNGTDAVGWATKHDLHLDYAWTLAEVSISGPIQVSLIKIF